VEKGSVLHILSVFVTLGIEHAVRMRRVILSYMACPAVHYCFTLSHKRHDFRKKKFIVHKIYVFLFTLQICL